MWLQTPSNTSGSPSWAADSAASARRWRSSGPASTHRGARTGRRRRRHLARQHLPGLPRATCPRTSTRSRSRPTPTGAATYSPAARDPGLPAPAWPNASAWSTALRFGHEVLERRLGRRRRSAGTSTRHGASSPPTWSSLRQRPLWPSPASPTCPGIDTFAGPAFHTARWRHDVDLTGLRVAVIGTGASAIQVVPAIQPRSPAPSPCSSARRRGCCPTATGRITAAERARCIRRVPAAQRLVRGPGVLVARGSSPGFC